MLSTPGKPGLCFTYWQPQHLTQVSPPEDTSMDAEGKKGDRTRGNDNVQGAGRGTLVRWCEGNKDLLESQRSMGENFRELVKCCREVVGDEAVNRSLIWKGLSPPVGQTFQWHEKGSMSWRGMGKGVGGSRSF